MLHHIFHHIFSLLFEALVKLLAERFAEYLWKRIALTSQTKNIKLMFFNAAIARFYQVAILISLGV